MGLDEVGETIEKLRPFADKVAAVNFDKKRFFTLCVRASFAKSFQFIDYAYTQTGPDFNSAFFLVPALRSITEDLIILRFLSTLPASDREVVVNGLMSLEYDDQITKQSEFFSSMRWSQPILRSSLTEQARTSHKDAVKNVWRNHGWPNLRRKQPPTRDIAKKCDPEFLPIIYDFFFSLTSGVVHFNPRVLLRSGWGQYPSATFSMHNMSKYYADFAKIYGAFLFSLYFDFFGRFLRPGDANRALVRDLRRQLSNLGRWPEMVTFEEMNMEVPKRNVILTAMEHLHSTDAGLGFSKVAKGRNEDE